MKKFIVTVAVVCLASAGIAVAQEHWTEGPVWAVSFYRTTPGHFDDYMKYLRTHSFLRTSGTGGRIGFT